MVLENRPRRWWMPLVILLLGIAIGADLGALTNIVNGPVSPTYFVVYMGWRDDVEFRAIGQGALEGGALGAAFGLVVSISFAASTRFRGTFGIAFRAMVLAVIIALGCWVIGGVAGVIFSKISPNWFFAQSGITFGLDVTRYAWVYGSIRGGYGGTFVGALASCIFQHRSWRRSCQREGTRFEVLPV